MLRSVHMFHEQGTDGLFVVAKLHCNGQSDMSRGPSVQKYFNALLWVAGENNVRQTSWQAAHIHELIKLLLPLGLWFSQKWKPNKFTVPFKPNLCLHLLWEQQNPLYRSLLSLYIATCADLCSASVSSQLRLAKEGGVKGRCQTHGCTHTTV